MLPAIAADGFRATMNGDGRFGVWASDDPDLAGAYAEGSEAHHGDVGVLLRFRRDDPALRGCLVLDVPDRPGEKLVSCRGRRTLTPRVDYIEWGEKWPPTWRRLR